MFESLYLILSHLVIDCGGELLLHFKMQITWYHYNLIIIIICLCHVYSFPFVMFSLDIMFSIKCFPHFYVGMAKMPEPYPALPNWALA